MRRVPNNGGLACSAVLCSSLLLTLLLASSGAYADGNVTADGGIGSKCGNHEDCQEHLRCEFRTRHDGWRCLDPCELYTPCSQHAECRVSRHQSICSCEPGYKARYIEHYNKNNLYCEPVVKCETDEQCADHEACSYGECNQPCDQPKACGPGAKCYTRNRRKICTCPQGDFGPWIGDPYVRCHDHQGEHPCHRKCLENEAWCALVNDQPVCYCPRRLHGNPYIGCKPECSADKDCPANLACLDGECRDPCRHNGYVCGTDSQCTVQDRKPVCSCPEGTTGNALLECEPIPDAPVQNATKTFCLAKCGDNTYCVNNTCVCLPNHVGDPYAGDCKPECVHGQDCPDSLTCIDAKCQDPCHGYQCGKDARCTVAKHVPSCSCLAGLVFDLESRKSEPYDCKVPECRVDSDCPDPKACNERNQCVSPCDDDPLCGRRAVCVASQHKKVCACKPGWTGNPYLGCRLMRDSEGTPELKQLGATLQCENNLDCPSDSTCYEDECVPQPYCTKSSSCPANMACIRNKCRDPCEDACGINAECSVSHRNPVCRCPSGYFGNVYAECKKLIPDDKEANTSSSSTPCNPSPCGKNTVCTVEDHVPKCKCAAGFFGDPDTAGCDVVSLKRVARSSVPTCADSESLCGPNANCLTINQTMTCHCARGFAGYPPNCYPIPEAQQKSVEKRVICLGDLDCPSHLACDWPTAKQVCVDPCLKCGKNTECKVEDHFPICRCLDGYYKDADLECLPVYVGLGLRNCNPSPCGDHSKCNLVNGTEVCSCDEGFSGSPPNCHPPIIATEKPRPSGVECVVNSDCTHDLTCRQNKCVDPCEGACAYNALCKVENHIPICTCPEGLHGDPFSSCYFACHLGSAPDSCDHNPCGPNSNCTIRNDHVVCTCNEGFVGSPPHCRSPSNSTENNRPSNVECSGNPDCSHDLACQQNKCVDPCKEACKKDAICKVINHTPTCSCSEGYEEGPFGTCTKKITISDPVPTKCVPNPCGPNSICRVINEKVACSCIEGFTYSSQNCRPDSNNTENTGPSNGECSGSADCSHDQACIQGKCGDPCEDSCGKDALCKVMNHNPICTCPEGLTGDPFNRCLKIVTISDPKPTPCVPSPCGPNSICRVIDDNEECSCVKGFTGSPPSCRPPANSTESRTSDVDECKINSECSHDLACLQNKCVDPCKGVCGKDSTCKVLNHMPVCSCSEGFTGDPFTYCTKTIFDPKPTKCVPSPCGPNSICRVIDDNEACLCIDGFTGSPPNCLPPSNSTDNLRSNNMKCVVNSDCSHDLTCRQNKCVDPCKGECGYNALCKVENHIPICTCPEGTSGDPFSACLYSPICFSGSVRCDDNQCGPNSNCHVINDHVACSCIEGFTGLPPNCRLLSGSSEKPEASGLKCAVNSDCSHDLACHQNKCVDPCKGVCVKDSLCKVTNHVPICSCSEGFTGDPFIRCTKTISDPVPTKCVPNPCGPNSECNVINDKESCTCIKGYTGLPPNCRTPDGSIVD